MTLHLLFCPQGVSLLHLIFQCVACVVFTEGGSIDSDYKESQRCGIQAKQEEHINRMCTTMY